MSEKDILDTIDIAEGIGHQAEHCRRNGADVTARVCEALIPLMQGSGEVGAHIAHWPGKPLEDALPLRIAGGLHHLHLSGADNRLEAIYDGKIIDQSEIDRIVEAVAADHEAALMPWFNSPPQTNEAGRSASFMAGLKWLSGEIGARFELNELGASAGINTMMERYHYDLNGVTAGPPASPMQIKPEWRGNTPPDNPVEITSICGCDQAPIELSDGAAALRVKSYVWPENRDRIARMNAAIKLASDTPPNVERADAADWVEKRLADPQMHGIARIFYHSIVWQYIPDDRKTRIRDAICTAGANATIHNPLAWMMLETNRQTFSHELILRYWNGGMQDGEPHLLGQAQAHGSWVEWF